MNQIGPGHFGHAAIRCDAGEIEVRLSPKGYWQLRTRAVDRDEWRLLCSGGFEEDGALFGSAPPIEDRRIQIGKLLLDAAARRVLVDGREVRLAAREYALLALLCSDPERVFTVPEIQRYAFSYGAPVTASRTVAVHASRLRVKLREAGAGETVVCCHGIGYRLTDGVELASVA